MSQTNSRIGKKYLSPSFKAKIEDPEFKKRLEQAFKDFVMFGRCKIN